MNDIRDAFESARNRLLAERTGDGHWEGYLSSSALSTATATSALASVSREKFATLIEAGARWLVEHQNSDGAWGDTPDSPSNLATTMLVQSAFALAGNTARTTEARNRAEEYLLSRAGAPGPARIAAIRACYGEDRTFSVPILTNCAIAGLVDWKDIPHLPFEIARMPQFSLRLFRLHVVSYALPALIAIGQLLHQKNPTRNPLARFLRNRAVAPTLRRLTRIQPASGGFLEATPLTSFVVMSLAASGRSQHPVAIKGVDFLVKSARPDGSWPIDTNLATWVTTQALDALSPSGPPESADALKRWLLDQQHREVHPYTGSAPDGWAWTDLPGGVPDADDTPGAIIALISLGVPGDDPAISAGIRWLLGLQNRDGGWPTFCRGWGKLPFDRSSADLTAHVIRAITLARGDSISPRERRAVARGFEFLRRTQRPDGSWVPLWFGNQLAPDHANPVYGTARVLSAYTEAGDPSRAEAVRAADFLLRAQNPDGGWGGAAGVVSTVEETALAVRAMAGFDASGKFSTELAKGAAFLAQHMTEKRLAKPAPIGLYFSSLWYSEKLYPIIWSVAALGRVLRNARSEDTKEP